MTSSPNRDGYLEWARYRELIRIDAARLLEMARAGLDALVPTCPDWTVADLVDHVAHVYAHKVAAISTGRRPDPWPPDELAGREPLGLFAEALSDLEATFDRHDPDRPTWTFYPDDPTVGFWVRRMAQETAVHRLDAELAHDAAGPIDAALAVDGVDEILKVMLAGPWWDQFDTEHPVDARVRVATGGRSWTVTASLRSVQVESPGGDHVDAEVIGDPQAVLLWLWGRPADDVATAGDPAVIDGFRGRLAEVSG